MRLEVTLDELHEIRVALSVAVIQLEGWVADHTPDNEDEVRIERIWALIERIPLT